LEYFRRNPNDFLWRMLTTDETWLYHYDRRQSNNQCSGAIAALPAPNNQLSGAIAALPAPNNQCSGAIAALPAPNNQLSGAIAALPAPKTINAVAP